jgi:ketosteroid isomerase-like protein
MGWRSEKVRELFRVYEERGVAAMLELVPDDVVWTPIVPGRSLVGEELRTYLEDESRRGGAREHDVLELEEIGDHVLAYGSLQVRSRDLHVDVQPCWLYRFEGDRLRTMTAYPTRARALEAITQFGPVGE